MSLTLKNITDVYEEYLRKENDKNAVERYIGKGGWFSASNAGGCYRKQAYKTIKEETDIPDQKSLFRMRIGSLIHDDIQRALLKYKHDGILITEGEIEIPELNVRGYFDIAELNGGIELVDLKTIAAYSWKRKFGRKENRDPSPSNKYELQLGTYGIGLQNKIGKDISTMRLIYYKKDDSTFKEIIVPKSYMNQAVEYWQEVNRLCLPEPKWDNLVPGEDMGIPFESWECNFCQYKSKCPSPFKKG